MNKDMVEFTMSTSKSCFNVLKLFLVYVQRWAKEWALGCVNSPPAAGGSYRKRDSRNLGPPLLPSLVKCVSKVLALLSVQAVPC